MFGPKQIISQEDLQRLKLTSVFSFLEFSEWFDRQNYSEVKINVITNCSPGHSNCHSELKAFFKRPSELFFPKNTFDYYRGWVEVYKNNLIVVAGRRKKSWHGPFCKDYFMLQNDNLYEVIEYLYVLFDELFNFSYKR